jgi:hypothetical protein
MALLGAFKAGLGIFVPRQPPILTPRCFAAASAAFVRSEITLVVFGNGRLRTQIANAHWKVSRSCHIRASCCAEDRIADLEAGAQLYREKAERADLCALSPFIRRLARPLSERERDAHCGIAYFVGEHAILDRARQHHTADA